MGQLEVNKYQHNKCPNGTLSPEELTKEAKQDNQVIGKEKKEKKRAAFCAVSKQSNAPNRSLRGQTVYKTKTLRTKP